MALSTTAKLILQANLSSALDLASRVSEIAYSRSYVYTSGAGAGQADLVWSDQRTLTASATEDLDLAGVLSDAFGAALTFARIKALIVEAAAGNTNNVQVTRPASNGVPFLLAAGDGIALRPGACMAWLDPTAAGGVVTAATGDLLTVTNSAGGTSVTYNIIIIGAAS